MKNFDKTMTPDNGAVSSPAIQGPKWDNSEEYPSLDSEKLEQDLSLVISLIEKIEDLSPKVAPYIEKVTKLTPPETNSVVPILQKIAEYSQDATTVLANVNTFASCIGSVEGDNQEAKSLTAKINSLFARLEQAGKSSELVLTLASKDLIKKYHDAESTRDRKFIVDYSRKLSHQSLSLAEEDLIVGLGVDGYTAWSTLYTNLSGVIKCGVKFPDGSTKEMGLAEAAGLAEDPSVDVRKSSYLAINDGWRDHSESCSAILNSLAGNRLEIQKRRSHTKPVHFLDLSLHKCRISKETLEAIMTSVESHKELGQKVVKLQAKALGLEKAGPWDRFAPPPSLDDHSSESKEVSSKLSFSGAIELISESFSAVHPEMGDFVKMMVDRKWIEGSVSGSKRPGAYCTKFWKSRSPRVFMTYSGGMKDVLTLAHELGHAFHNWKLKDLPMSQAGYPMTLAETASIFAETVVNNAMSASAKDKKELFKVQWDDARDSESLLLNVSSRFTFEKEFYEKRNEGILNSTQISELMKNSWQRWYGDCLSEYDDLFWCSKLHFHLASVSFYNYPYIFGYLFALGVYAQKERLGNDFYPAYVDLLRDTGRMTAEEVAQKHLGADLTDQKFWLDSLGIVSEKVSRFETSVNELFS